MKAGVLIVGMSLLSFGGTVVEEFKRLGDNLHLKVNTSIKNHSDIELEWKFGENDPINIIKVRGFKTTVYGERAALKENFSLLLKNLQLNDSGVYTAIISEKKDKTLAKYSIIVKAPVSPVNLTVTNSSSGCNLNISCSSQASAESITATCDAKKCIQGSDVNDSKNIVVFVDQDHIICNHSNEVSWSLDKVEINAYCGERSVSSGGTAIAAIGAAFGVGFLLALSTYFYRKRKIHKKAVNILPQNEVGNSENDPPSTTYALVEFSRPPANPNDSDKPDKAETVYSVIQRPTKPLPSAVMAEDTDED